jgi:hypothetical protein
VQLAFCSFFHLKHIAGEFWIARLSSKAASVGGCGNFLRAV